MGLKDRFSKEALKAQDGKSVPLTLENGGPVIGEAKLHFDDVSGELRADFNVTHPGLKKLLESNEPPTIL